MKHIDLNCQRNKSRKETRVGHCQQRLMLSSLNPFHTYAVWVRLHAVLGYTVFRKFFAVQGTVFVCRRYAHGTITATWWFLRFGAFLIAERRPRSNVIRSTRMTYGNHGVITLYTRMAAVSSRIRAVYSRIYTVGSRIFTDIRGGFANICVFYTGFAEALVEPQRTAAWTA